MFADIVFADIQSAALVASSINAFDDQYYIIESLSLPLSVAASRASLYETKMALITKIGFYLSAK